MAAENMSDWSATPATINEAVFSAANFLNDLLDKYESTSEASGCYLMLKIEDVPSNTFAIWREEGVSASLISKFLGKGWSLEAVASSMIVLREELTEAQTARLRARGERQKAKAEAARLEANRLKEEAAQKAQAEQERKQRAEQKRIEAEERRKAEEAAALDMDDESESILRGFAEQRKIVLKFNFRFLYIFG
ncbi:hypothetical protein [Fundidesulfovibrio putealis]|uniref:hypothetical protein n=1 Tax=Fundidesulfovibrio putealis TaxID=270496 RepID=UPI000489E683|nr:hypothetical protein [Fundidesulfovibrio putealis]